MQSLYLTVPLAPLAGALVAGLLGSTAMAQTEHRRPW